MSNMNESVGKRIVEALKRQSENDLPLSSVPPKSSAFQPQRKIQEQETLKEAQTPAEEIQQQPAFNDIFAENNDMMGTTIPITQSKPASILNDSFDSISGFNEPEAPQFASLNEPAAFEMPSNIVVLKKLISQLPSGVSRHTGAQIIKQTMEALGISMRSVLQDAQQVQENLKNSAKECQSYIQEYKKQIVSLEKQSQNYQKQYAALNDLISLFIQANK